MNWERYRKADLEKTTTAAATKAAEKSRDSFDVTIKLPLTRSNMSFSFWFNYLYKDPETLLITEGPRSPIVTHGFDVPNLTKGVQNLTVTAGFKSYGVKFTIDPTSVQEDIVIFESLTADFANQYIVYVGTSTNVTINTSDFAPRWIKVRSRDKWLTQNNTDVIAIGPDAGGSVIPKNADPDTSTPPSAPTGVSVVGSIDANDKSGFSGKITASWTAKTDANTSGYVIRWTTQNPATTTNPLWEYGQVDGKATTTFDITGLTPNTLYYWQVTAKSPYNSLTWVGAQSGTVGPILDANAPSDAFAQLRSILSIGGKTADLFKIGTGISQSINTSTTITPSQTSGTYSGIVLNRSTTNSGHNYWLNTGQFRVGSATAFLYWDGSDIYTTGKINATGGSFTGDVQLNGGTLFAGASPNSGARVRFNNSGIFAYDANNNPTVAITQADGKIDARQGYIGGWTINGSAQTTGTISKNGTILDSSGNITLGDVTGTLASIVRLSSTDTHRLWIGSQSSSTAPFKVTSAGKLYATGVVVSGDIEANSLSVGTTWNGTSLTNINTNANKGASAVQPSANLEVDITTRAIKKIIASSGMPITNNGSYPVVLDNSGLRMLKPGSTTDYTVYIDSSTGSAVFKGDITGATGTFSGPIRSNIPASALVPADSSYFDSQGSLGGVSSGLVIGAIGFKNTSVGGWTSHCYPYMPGAPNIDLGTRTYRWNDVRISGNLMVGHSGADNDTNGTTVKIKLTPAGPIYANNLGTGTGNSIVQDAGFLKVQVSSSRYKENIIEINKSGYLDIINSLKPVTYNYIGDAGYNGNPRTLSGLIAEDLHEIPNLRTVVNYNEENQPDGIAYDRLNASIILAIQELSDMVESLQQEVNTLKGI